MTHMVESLQKADDVWCQRPFLLLGPLAMLKLSKINALQPCQVNQSQLLLKTETAIVM